MSMKCRKSRNAKKSASATGSAGTGESPSCRAASSATMRGEAEPTWCTCSSTLGSPAMNEVSSVMVSLLVGGPRHDENAAERERDGSVRGRVRGRQLPPQLGAEGVPGIFLQGRLDGPQR